MEIARNHSPVRLCTNLIDDGRKYGAVAVGEFRLVRIRRVKVKCCILRLEQAQ